MTDPLPLPLPNRRDGAPRRVGVEIELGALPEADVTGHLADVLGGRAERADKGWTLAGSDLGDVQVYLDSRFVDQSDSALGRAVRDVARTVVPVEIVTQPILPDRIAALDAALARLAGAGATGTSAGPLLGFGVHFNPEVTGEGLDDILPVMTAFALLEDHLRAVAGIDLSRRALPFVGPWPRALVDRLAGDPPDTIPALIDLYLELAPSRNHALDMLCLFAHLDRDRVAARLDMAMIGARPTWHFRLPDCRVDEPGWSLALEWNRWVLVETVAQDAALMDRLRTAWADHRAALTTIRTDWAPRARALIAGEETAH